MLLLPIRTDRRLKRKPWINISFLTINVLVFAANGFLQEHQWFTALMLNPKSPYWTQFLTYQFLHHDLRHLLGNMFFLGVFGNNVEDRLGKTAYLIFYLAGGVVAGIGHCIMETTPVLGASGSVAAVTGAFLVLFPNTRITIFYWLIVFGFFELASLVVIGFQIAQNLIMQLVGGNTHYAYIAHLSGYAMGILIAGILLLTKRLPSEPYDLRGMYLSRLRRKAMRTMPLQTHDPWKHPSTPSPGSPPGIAPDTSPTNTHDGLHDTTCSMETTSEKQTQNIGASLRQQVTTLLEQHQLPQAARQYAQLLEVQPRPIFSQQKQLDLANQLMASSQYAASARAYELFLETYRTNPHHQEVQVLLGLIYTRYLPRKQRARELLTHVQPQLHHTSQADMVKQLLEELEPKA